jgi:alanine dehydrogenase
MNLEKDCYLVTWSPPTDVVILGAGTVGEFAAKTAIGLGSQCKGFDNSITKLRRLQNNLNQRILPPPIQIVTKSIKT